MTETKLKPTTVPKRTLSGYEDLVNPKTGEIFPVQMYEVEDVDFDFRKVWVQNLIAGLNRLSTQSLKFAFWLVRAADSDNKICFTQRQMTEKSGISLKTISRTLGILQESNFLKRINISNYQINPDIIYKGKHENRMGVCYRYNSEVEKMSVTNYADKIYTLSEIKKIATGVAKKENLDKISIFG
jgi:DNA-binding transcriptional regulator YhcF (GntR family)